MSSAGAFSFDKAKNLCGKGLIHSALEEWIQNTLNACRYIENTYTYGVAVYQKYLTRLGEFIILEPFSQLTYIF